MAIFKQVKLGAVCDVRDGTHDSPKPYFSGFPLVTSKHIKNRKIDLSETYFINRDDFEQINKRSKVNKWDILFSMIGTVGEVALVKTDPTFAIKNVGLIKTNNERLSKYLFYYLWSPKAKRDLESLLSGSTQKFISLGKLREFPIDLPSEEIQSYIASLLSAYDDLIENNEKRIKALEEMSQLMYTEWFVKFKFPDYEKVRMVDSGTEYGMIPEGWEVKRLDKVIRIIRGRSYSSEQISDYEGEYYIVNLKSFNRGGGFRLNGEKYYTGVINNDQLLKQGDIVVAVTDMTNDRAVIARPARVPNILTHKVTLSADVVKVISDEIPSSFLFYCLLDHRFTEATKHKANGANVLHLKPSAIGEYKALLPSSDLLMKFAILCEAPFDLIDRIKAQNADLEKMRDLLIPQLVTGKRTLKI